MAVTTVYRSMSLLRDQGYSVCKTEHRNKWSFRTHDLFQFGDLVGVRADKTGVLAVQSTTTDHQSTRFKKIIALPEALVWLQAGNRIVVHGWTKRDGRWYCTVTPVTVDDMNIPEQEAPTQENDHGETEKG